LILIKEGFGWWVVRPLSAYCFREEVGCDNKKGDDADHGNRVILAFCLTHIAP